MQEGVNGLYSKLGLSGDTSDHDKRVRIAAALTRRTYINNPPTPDIAAATTGLLADIRALLAGAASTEVADVLKDMDRLFPGSPKPTARSSTARSTPGRGRGARGAAVRGRGRAPPTARAATARGK